MRRWVPLLVAIFGCQEGTQLLPPSDQPICGNGVIDSGELCDDGTNDGRYGGCNADCTPAARCGDGVLQPNEACDDGAANGDGPGMCRARCALPRCGDGVLDFGMYSPLGEVCLAPERVGGAAAVRTVILDISDFDGDGRDELLIGREEVLEILSRFDDGYESMARIDGELGEVLARDMDNDGDVDVVLQGSSGVTVFENRGEFSFVRTAAFETVQDYDGRQAFPTDLDGDGRVDLIFSSASTLEVWRNTDASFVQTYQRSNPQEHFRGVSDVDGDGTIDLHLLAGPSSSYVRGLGGARFEDLPIPLVPHSVRLADVDGDGWDEVLYSPSNPETSLHIRFADGTEVVEDVGFSVEQPFWVADLNGDAAEEILVPTDEATIVLRVVDRSVVRVASLSSTDLGKPGWMAATGDLDSDGRRDVVLGPSNWAEVWLQLEADTFSRTRGAFLTTERYRGVARFSDEQPALVGLRTVFPWSALGGEPPAMTSVELTPGGAALADFDGDGWLDLVGGGEVLSGLGLEFGPPGPTAGSGRPIAGDVNRDGRLDIIRNESDTDGLVVELNLGGLAFDAPQPILRDDHPARVADLDGDGFDDLLAGGRLWFGTPSGSFEPDPLAPPMLRSSQRAFVERDQTLFVATISGVDVFTRTSTAFIRTAALPVSEAVALSVHERRLYVLDEEASYHIFQLDDLQMIATGRTIDGAGRGLVVSDLSGDGREDLIVMVDVPWSRDAAGTAAVLVGDDSGYTLRHVFGHMRDPTSLQVGDVDGDGHQDVAISADVMLGRGGLFIYFQRP